MQITPNTSKAAHAKDFGTVANETQSHLVFATRERELRIEKGCVY